MFEPGPGASVTRKQRALLYAREHRSIHEQWIAYWRENPPRTAEQRELRGAVGGITHHRNMARRYDTIIKVLLQAAG